MGRSMVKRWMALNWFNSYLKECNHVWQAKLHWKGWKGLWNQWLKFKTLVSNLSLCFWCNTCPDNKYISWSIIISSTGLGLLWFSIPIHLSLGWWWSQQLPALDSSSWRKRRTGWSCGSWKTVSLRKTRSGSETHFTSKTSFSPILILAHTGTKCSQSSSGERNLLQSEGHPKYH